MDTGNASAASPSPLPTPSNTARRLGSSAPTVSVHSVHTTDRQMPATTGGYRQWSGNLSGSYNVQSERIVSSTVLKEEFLNGQPQQDRVKYIEVPVIEEVIRHVPKKEIVEVEKKVPRYDIEWVEKIVEVPQIQYVDKQVEVPQIREVIKHVPVRQVVEVPHHVIKYVPKIENRIVEKEVEVPGEIIEIPCPYVVENKVVVPRYVDQEVSCVVAQSLHPVIFEAENEYVDVEMREFNPYLVPVDVMVPRPVARQLVAHKKTEEHKIVDIPVGHFNAMLRQINTDLTDADLEGRYQTVGGVIPISTGVRFMPLTSPQAQEIA